MGRTENLKRAKAIIDARTEPPPNKSAPDSCQHRGAPTGVTAPCSTGCGKGVRHKVFTCALHGTCTIPRSDIKSCAGCADRVPLRFLTKPLAPSEVLARHNTDKEKIHRYGEIYDEILKNRAPQCVLELGVLEGGSISAWRELFPHAEIHAADLEPDCERRLPPDSQFHLLDITDRAALTRFASERAGRFDLIVEDTSHVPDDQQAIANLLTGALAPGGILVIEDVYDDACCEYLSRAGGRVYDRRAVSGHSYSRCVAFTRTDYPAIRPAPRRPRILFASHDLSLSGAPIILANLIPHLRGIDAVLYSPHDGPLAARFHASGVAVTHTLPSLTSFDAVVANTLLSARVVAAARAAGVPCVWMIHESDPTMCGNFGDVREESVFARVIFPCQSTADAYRELVPNPHIVPSIVPYRRSALSRGMARCTLRIDDGEFIVLTAGRDEPRKGQQDIRRAVRDLPNVRLITLEGRGDMLPYYAAADLYVCSSRIEAFPLSLQEAKLHNLPVITTPVFGCSEIIRDGIDGLHYQPGDVADLRAKIELIRTDAAVRAQFSSSLTHLPTFDESVASYERHFLSLTGTGAQPLRVVYHSAGFGHWWKGIVREQFALLARVGLRDVLNTHVGVEPNWVLDEAARHGLNLTMCEQNADIKQYEMPAMRLMERLARHGDEPILYLHTKGASHHPQRGALYHDWRKLMQHELVEKWRENLANLDTHDLVGVNWHVAYPHFSGNFWLSRADWVRKLPPYNAIHRDRYSCERWIGMKPNPRVKSLVCRQKSFWIAGADQELMYAALRSGSK